MAKKELTPMQQLVRLRDKYDEKAQAYWTDYQINGFSSQLRSYERNQRLSDALTDAINAKDVRSEKCRLENDVLSLDAGSETLADDVRRLQNHINGLSGDGQYVPPVGGKRAGRWVE